MAAFDSVRAQIALANGEKVFVAGLASGAASAGFDLSLYADADGKQVRIELAPSPHMRLDVVHVRGDDVLMGSVSRV